MFVRHALLICALFETRLAKISAESCDSILNRRSRVLSSKSKGAKNGVLKWLANCMKNCRDERSYRAPADMWRKDNWELFSSNGNGLIWDILANMRSHSDSDFLNVMNLPVGKFVVPGRCMQGVENPYHLESLANSLASVLGKFTPTSQSKRPIRAHKEAAKIILQWNNYYVARPGTSRYHDDHKIIHSNVRDLFRSGFELYLEKYARNLPSEQKKLEALLSNNFGEKFLQCPPQLARGTRDLRNQRVPFQWMLDPTEDEALSRTSRANDHARARFGASLADCDSVDENRRRGCTFGQRYLAEMQSYVLSIGREMNRYFKQTIKEEIVCNKSGH